MTIPVSSAIHRRLGSIALALLLGAATARADELSEVQALYRTGRTAAAMARADKALAQRPDDPQLRFFKGVMLSDAKRNDEALDIFQRLTEDHPDLAEPYNNLATLYAAGGDYAKARATLELALRADPRLAAAHVNLGDIYVAMAGQSYARALQLDATDASLAPKLALVRQLLAPQAAAPAAR